MVSSLCTASCIHCHKYVDVVMHDEIDHKWRMCRIISQRLVTKIVMIIFGKPTFYQYTLPVQVFGGFPTPFLHVHLFLKCVLRFLLLFSQL